MKKSNKAYIEIFVLMCGLFFVLVYFVGLRHFSVNTPMNYDSVISGNLLAKAKMICTSNCINSKGFLMTLLDASVLKVLYLISGNVAFSLNVYTLLCFVTAALSAYFVMKKLKMGSFACVFGPIVFAMSTYMYAMSIYDFGAANVAFVPITIWIALEIYKNKAVVSGNRKYYTLTAILLMCLSGAGYTAFFCGILIMTAGVSSTLKGNGKEPILTAVLLTVILLVVSLLLNLPYYISGSAFWAYNSSAVATSEVNGLKLIQLFFPVGLGMSGISDFYNKNTIMSSVINSSSYIGIIGIIGLVIGIISLLRPIRNKDAKSRLVALSEMIVVMLFVCQSGGLGSILVFIFYGGLTDLARGAIYINFICIVIFFVYLGKVAKSFNNVVILATALLLIAVSLYSSAPVYFKGYFGDQEEQQMQERILIKIMENQLGNDAKVFQPRVIGKYKPGNDKNGVFYEFNNRSIGYFLSDKLSWNTSVACDYESECWNNDVSRMAIKDMVKQLREEGVGCIFIDRSNYLGQPYLEMELGELENTLKHITNNDFVKDLNNKIEYIRIK